MASISDNLLDTMPVLENGFTRLQAILDDIEPPKRKTYELQIGEPSLGVPEFVGEEVARHAERYGSYPPLFGLERYREAVVRYLERRTGNTIPTDSVVATCGSLDALVLSALVAARRRADIDKPAVALPDPWYNGWLAGGYATKAEPVFLPTLTTDGRHEPDFSELTEEKLARLVLLYVNSPANPTGSCLSKERMLFLAHLAQKHNFLIVSDECYVDVWHNQRPLSWLEVDPELSHVLVQQSLSKRSSAPGLRCGFICGGTEPIEAFKHLFRSAGARPPEPLQHAGARLWDDELHVTAQNAFYRRQIDLAKSALADWPGFHPPEAGFFLWLPVANSIEFTRAAWKNCGVRVLPSWTISLRGENGFVRVSLTLDHDDTAEALRLLAQLGPAARHPL